MCASVNFVFQQERFHQLQRTTNSKSTRIESYFIRTLDPFSVAAVHPIQFNCNGTLSCSGPELHFNVESIIAVCGAPVSVSLNNEEVPLWTRIHVPAGGVLKFGKFEDVGSRAYLAVFGGIDVPDYLQSKSTSVECAIGGYQGRTLR